MSKKIVHMSNNSLKEQKHSSTEKKKFQQFLTNWYIFRVRLG